MRLSQIGVLVADEEGGATLLVGITLACSQLGQKQVIPVTQGTVRLMGREQKSLGGP